MQNAAPNAADRRSNGPGGLRSRSNARRLVLLAAAVVAVTLAGCLPAPAPPPPPSPPSPPTTLQVSASPDLFPAFDPSITDYVVRCNDATVTVNVGAPSGTTVSVDGGAPASGYFAAAVHRTSGEAFTIVVAGAVTGIYSVRCLPPDFPPFEAERTGSPQAEWYITAPSALFAPTYPTVFDSYGVPVWWGPKTSTVFAELLPDGNFGWTKNDGTAAEEHALDGSLVGTAASTDGATDLHDLLRLANGNYVVVSDVARAGVDFSSWGGPASATVLDHVIEELTPSGTVVWSWDVADHISIDATDPQWRSTILSGAQPYDAYHWNSIESTPTGYLLSFRHLDAVYAIDRTNGQLEWKLGGSPEPESLTIAGDPVFAGGSHFGGQHDARMLADGSVTIFDDGTDLGRAPRGVRYQIDTTHHVATMLEQVSDAIAPSTSCCGSARRLNGGDWVFAWGGGNNAATEVAPDGARVFRLQFPENQLLYRVIPVPYGVLDRAALRAGMNAQYP